MLIGKDGTCKLIVILELILELQLQPQLFHFNQPLQLIVLQFKLAELLLLLLLDNLVFIIINNGMLFGGNQDLLQVLTHKIMMVPDGC